MLYHGEHGHLQGTQGTHKYILTICLVLVISWRTWTPTRNSRLHINYIVFGAVSWRTWILCLVLGQLYHGEHGRLQGTQGTHKYILTILCLVLGHVISWRTWTPTRNSRHTQVHINYLVFGARPCYIMENMDAYKELKAHTSTY